MKSRDDGTLMKQDLAHLRWDILNRKREEVGLPSVYTPQNKASMDELWAAEKEAGYRPTPKPSLKRLDDPSYVAFLDTRKRIVENQRIDYDEYLMSAEWQVLRRRIMARDGFSCRICGKEEKLAVHHLTYDRLGREKDEDLITLCGGDDGCHRAIHYDDNGKRRKGWKKYNPPPILPHPDHPDE